VPRSRGNGRSVGNDPHQGVGLGGYTSHSLVADHSNGSAEPADGFLDTPPVIRCACTFQERGRIPDFKLNPRPSHLAGDRMAVVECATTLIPAHDIEELDCAFALANEARSAPPTVPLM
jgi:hypothetical protein